MAMGALSVIGMLAHAQDTANANTLDIAYAFGDNSQTVNFATLDTKSMQETQGAAIYVIEGNELSILDYGSEPCSSRYCYHYSMLEDEDTPTRRYYPYNRQAQISITQYNQYDSDFDYRGYQHQPWVTNAVGAVLGGLGGHFGYMGGAISSGQYSYKDHLVAVGGGAIGGGISPVRGLGSAVATFGTTTAVTGVSTHVGNSTQKQNIKK